jgi:hypothetical protein
MPSHPDPLRVILHRALNLFIRISALFLPFVVCVFTLHHDLRACQQTRTDTREKDVQHGIDHHIG